MNHRKQTTEDIFHAAMELPAGERRQHYVQQVCADDEPLLRSLEELLEGAEIGEAILEVASSGGNCQWTPKAGHRPGDRIGRYRLLEKIGEGGCGIVYMAEQEEPVRRRVALKVIKPGMDSREVIARFEAERQALALMDHPHIARVFDGGVVGANDTEAEVGCQEPHTRPQSSDVRPPPSDFCPPSMVPRRPDSDPGRPYFVMELVHGVRITDYCGDHGLSTPERLQLFMQVCSAVQHAHQKGIIHRDLKPSNILVTELDGRPVPKVIDFGIARATERRPTDKTLFTHFVQLVGTPAYMSPEQAALSSADIDTRSDIYSLGVLLYEMLTGTTPFDAKELLSAGFDEMRRIIRETEPPRPSTRLTQAAMPPVARRPGSLSSMSPEAAPGQLPKAPATENCRLAPDPVNPPQERRATNHSTCQSLPSDLDWIVMKCLEKDRARRYETATGLAQDVERHLRSEPVTARPPSAAYRFRKMVRRNKFAFAAASAVLTALIAGLGAASWMFLREKRAREREYQAMERAIAAEKSQSEERKKAEMEASRSSQVAEFLKNMLAGVGPSVARGDDTAMLRKILDRTAERLGEELKNQPHVEADLRTSVGKIYRDLGQYEKAAVMLNEALAITKTLCGDEHAEVARLLNELAMVLCQQGDLGEAERLQREALTMQRRLLGRDADVTSSLNNLGTILADRGQLVEAETTHREALALNRRLKGNEHEDVGLSLNNLAVVLDEQGKPGEAETMLRVALALQRKRLGDEHPDCAATLNNLANAVRKQKKLTEAETLYRELLVLQRKLLGNEHPNVAAALNGLGLNLLDLGHTTEAEGLLREAVAIEKKARNGAHPQTARLVGNLGRVLQEQRKSGEAEALYRSALSIYAELPGGPHPDVSSWRNRLYNLLHAQEKHGEMESILREDLESARTHARSDPARLETCLDDLAKHLHETGRFAQAVPPYRELLEMRRARLGPDHPLVVGAMSSLSLVLVDCAWSQRHSDSATEGEWSENIERAREAEGLMRECLAIWGRRPVSDDEQWTTDELRGRLGSALTVRVAVESRPAGDGRLEKFTEAEALLLESARALGKNPKVARRHRRASVARVLRLYEAWGQPAKAAEWQSKLAIFDQRDVETTAGGRSPAHNP